ncbi:hypothetical protein M430DRAFT_68100 [Amorphotheca resinae ATCC 22711]|uniref:Heat shock factor binding protein 1 n=1 Tax=Amorphotheca resinae ATCC 22711 TaxID=857342 RepID=A0A2T3AW90_AMORE|nr:hypothetical protein M430DRAFT_68100 [Amorphotheca resinae ATCC 22711]PSS12944.1 hypothetical protein M430DRAFT_68100 [Amorphotheca resinae ATCC 22711]
MASSPSSSALNNSQQSADSVTSDAAAPAELSAVVDELLNSLSNKFASVSKEIFSKMDDMSRRLDNLEAALQSSGTETREGAGSPASK